MNATKSLKMMPYNVLHFPNCRSVETTDGHHRPPEVAETATKLSPVLLRKYSLGGYTIDKPR